MSTVLSAALDACLAPSLDFLLDVERGAAEVLDDDRRTATGETKRSLYVDPPARQGNTVTGTVGASSPHAVFVKTGRQPGTPPPFRAIARWVEVKLGYPDGEAPYPLVRAIQQAIGRRGTDGTDFLGRPARAMFPFFVDALVTTLPAAVGEVAHTEIAEAAEGLSLTLTIGGGAA